MNMRRDTRKKEELSKEERPDSWVQERKETKEEKSRMKDVEGGS